MSVKTYNSKRVIIVFGGVPLSGYADGTFLTITPNAERYTKKVGADGEVGRSKSNNNTHEVTLTLLSSSPSNTVLSSFITIDKVTDLGALPLQVIDLSGTTVFFWLQAWLRQPADVEFGKEITERAWTFDTGQATTEIIGGDII